MEMHARVLEGFCEKQAWQWNAEAPGPQTAAGVLRCHQRQRENHRGCAEQREQEGAYRHEADGPDGSEQNQCTERNHHPYRAEMVAVVLAGHRGLRVRGLQLLATRALSDESLVQIVEFTVDTDSVMKMG